MPRVPTSLFRGLGRGIVRSGVLKPAVIGTGFIGTAYTVGGVLEKKGRADNPPIQTKGIDTDGDGRADALWTGDPRTGAQNLVGDANHKQLTDNERSEERTQQLLIYGGIAAIIAIVVLRGA